MSIGTRLEMLRRGTESKGLALYFGLLVLVLLATTPARAQALLSDEQIGEIAQQGVVYGLPLVLMDKVFPEPSAMCCTSKRMSYRRRMRSGLSRCTRRTRSLSRMQLIATL
jgi:hypothetical protein